MDSADSACREAQRAYLTCLRGWFRGTMMHLEASPNVDCREAFEEYRDCVTLYFQQAQLKTQAAARHLGRGSDAVAGGKGGARERESS